MTLDYVGSYSAEQGSNLLHYGVPGMKWGVRNVKGNSLGALTDLQVGGLGAQGIAISFVKGTDQKPFTDAEHKEVSDLAMSARQQLLRKDSPLHTKVMPDLAKKHTDMSKPETRKAYDADVEKAFQSEINKIIPKGATSTVVVAPKRIEIVVGQKDAVDAMRQVLVTAAIGDGALHHSSLDALIRITLDVERDESGQITGLSVPGDLKQSGIEPTDFLAHYGVPGMKWGVRKAKDHSTSTSNVKRQGTGTKRGLVTDFTVSPYRSVGRIKSGKTTFEKLNPKQQNKLEKSLARDLGKTLEKRLDRKHRGQTDYLAAVQRNPALRDSLIKRHGSLFRFGQRDLPKYESRKQYLTTYSNYPRVLTFGAKTNSAVYTLGLSAALSKAFSKHSDDIEPNDYIGAVRTASDDVEHYGVPGMKWGVRRSRSSGGAPRPTRARAKEVAAAAKAKEANKLTERAEKIKSGTGRPLVLNGRVLSREQSVKHLERQAEKLGVKPKKDTAKKPEVDEILKKSNEDAAKYAALKAQAKEKGPSSLTDEELKFVNSRSEALKKTQALIAKPDSWLKKRVKSAADTAVKQALQVVTDAGTAKLKDLLKGMDVPDAKTASNAGSTKARGSSRPFRTTATQAGPGWPTSPNFYRKPIGRAPKALPPGPVYKVTTL